MTTVLGTWVYQCASAWVDRYDDKAYTLKRYNEVGKAGTTSAILAVLGFFGIDGELVGEEEVGSTAAAILSRLGVPIGFEKKMGDAERARDIFKKIEETL